MVRNYSLSKKKYTIKHFILYILALKGPNLLSNTYFGNLLFTFLPSRLYAAQHTLNTLDTLRRIQLCSARRLEQIAVVKITASCCAAPVTLSNEVDFSGARQEAYLTVTSSKGRCAIVSSKAHRFAGQYFMNIFSVFSSTNFCT